MILKPAINTNQSLLIPAQCCLYQEIINTKNINDKNENEIYKTIENEIFKYIYNY